MKIRKVIVMLAIAAVLGNLSVMSAAAREGTGPSTAAAASAAPSVSPQSDGLEWVYKVERGKLYKCLCNTATGELVGKWQYVCDWPS